MKLSVNGENVEFSEGISVNEMLVIHKVKQPDMVSVEVNGEILERKSYDSTALKDGDHVEFLYFMGGGR